MTERRLRDVISELRAKAEGGLRRAETAEAKGKELEQVMLEKDHEIKSLQFRIEKSDDALAIAEEGVQNCKVAKQEAEAGCATTEGLIQKITLLEDKLNDAKRNLKENVEKCVFSFLLSQLDVKADNFERQVHGVEQDRDQLEKKCEVCKDCFQPGRDPLIEHLQTAQAKCREVKAELDELIAEMEGL
ncbi:actin filament-coating protein tropomyosin [Mycena leptocephala]|nr:actin filament-coating protein tropomyosin [Mycena leptocephala]